MQKHEGEVAAVEDHDIARRQGIEMGERCGPLVGIGRQGEVDRRLGVEAVQAGHQPLRIVGVGVGKRVAGLDQRAGQVHLGSVDGEGAVVLPSAAVCAVTEDFPVQVKEQVLVYPGPGLADRRGGHRLALRQCDPQLPALVPQLREYGGVALAASGQDQAETRRA